jgi:hypothetical protein
MESETWSGVRGLGLILLRSWTEGGPGPGFPRGLRVRACRLASL